MKDFFHLIFLATDEEIFEEMLPWKSLSDSHGYPENPCPIHMGTLKILVQFTWVRWKSLSDSRGYPRNPCHIFMGTLKILVRCTWVAWKSLSDSHGYLGNPFPIYMGTLEIIVHQECFKLWQLSSAGVYIKVTCGVLLLKQWRESRTF